MTAASPLLGPDQARADSWDLLRPRVKRSRGGPVAAGGLNVLAGLFPPAGAFADLAALAVLSVAGVLVY
jgi:hypothetical protein